jgi:hypothetical protein
LFALAAGYHLAMSASTINTLVGILFLTPILLGLWLALRAMVKSRPARAVLVVVIVWLLVYPPIRIAIVAIPPGELLCGAALTAAIVVLHNKFSRR